MGYSEEILSKARAQFQEKGYVYGEIGRKLSFFATEYAAKTAFVPTGLRCPPEDCSPEERKAIQQENAELLLLENEKQVELYMDGNPMGTIYVPASWNIGY